MVNQLTEDTRAIVLLCGVFEKNSTAKPLQLREYNDLVRWLVSKKLRPKDLLNEETRDQATQSLSLDERRLSDLLNRGIQLGFAMEEWHRNGLWVISRSDKIYPQRYRQHLKDKAPPLLFGAGDPALLTGGGLAIIGSRNVDEQGEECTRSVAQHCAANKLPVVSGGARGVDQISMTSALKAGGTVIGVLADSLLKKSLIRDARQAISQGRLLLISPYHPNAGFTIGTAMGRNKLIYAMADYALVISADDNKGGTWAGAEEELKRPQPIPVFTRQGQGTPEGNRKLLELGAIKWPSLNKEIPLVDQLNESISQAPKPTQDEELTLFDPFPEDLDKMT